MAQQHPQHATEVIEQIVDDELVIYNVANDEVHLLNPTTATVWHYCDGEHDIDAITAATTFDTDIVWAALRELDRAQLLTEPLAAPDTRISRRRLMKRIAIGAVALPVVTSIVAPNAAAAASGPPPCTPGGLVNSCNNDPGTCCSTVCINGLCA